MRHALERIDVSENVARRKRFEFVTLAGVKCGLIGFGAFAGAAFVQGGYYKGILYIGAGVVVFGFSLYLRTRGFTSAVSYTYRLQNGEGADRVAILQLFSEVIVLSGAWALFANAVLAVLTDSGIELLSLAGLIMLIVGVNLSLRVEELARAKERELWERGLRPMVLLLPSSGDDALCVRRRFSLGRPGASSYPDAGFARVIRERLNDAGRVVTISDSDYFVTTHPIRKSASTRAYERRERIREDAAACRLGSRQTSRGGLTTKGQGAYAEGSPRCDDHREDREDRRAGRKVQRLDGAYPLNQGDVGIPARELPGDASLLGEFLSADLRRRSAATRFRSRIETDGAFRLQEARGAASDYGRHPR
jgi:hypothetical protein